MKTGGPNLKYLEFIFIFYSFALRVLSLVVLDRETRNPRTLGLCLNKINYLFRNENIITNDPGYILLTERYS